VADSKVGTVIDSSGDGCAQPRGSGTATEIGKGEASFNAGWAR
jgi:hypothetical protein